MYKILSKLRKIEDERGNYKKAIMCYLGPVCTIAKFLTESTEYCRRLTIFTSFVLVTSH